MHLNIIVNTYKYMLTTSDSYFYFLLSNFNFLVIVHVCTDGVKKYKHIIFVCIINNLLLRLLKLRFYVQLEDN